MKKKVEESDDGKVESNELTSLEEDEGLSGSSSERSRAALTKTDPSCAVMYFLNQSKIGSIFLECPNSELNTPLLCTRFYEYDFLFA